MRNVKDKTKTTAKAEEPLLEARIDARCVDPRVLKLMDELRRLVDQGTRSGHRVVGLSVFVQYENGKAYVHSTGYVDQYKMAFLMARAANDDIETLYLRPRIDWVTSQLPGGKVQDNDPTARDLIEEGV